MTRARYRAAKERILKMSIYDQNSLNDVQLMLNTFFNLSGTNDLDECSFQFRTEIEIEEISAWPK